MTLNYSSLLNEEPKIMSFLLFGAGFTAATIFFKWRSRRSLPSQEALKQIDHGDVLGEHKMVLIVRMDLKMGKGKIAAQCAHAAVGAVEKLAYENMSALRHWQKQGQPKVVLKVNNETSLFDIIKAAQKKSLNTCLISDAGRTQIAPGSKTVLAVGPGPAAVIDEVTGHLKLL